MRTQRWEERAPELLRPGHLDQHRFERRLVWSGEGLVLSERTAQNHVQHILTKLGLTNRSQVAVWVNSRKSSMPAE